MSQNYIQRHNLLLLLFVIFTCKLWSLFLSWLSLSLFHLNFIVFRFREASSNKEEKILNTYVLWSCLWINFKLVICKFFLFFFSPFICLPIYVRMCKLQRYCLDLFPTTYGLQMMGTCMHACMMFLLICCKDISIVNLMDEVGNFWFVLRTYLLLTWWMKWDVLEISMQRSQMFGCDSNKIFS